MERKKILYLFPGSGISQKNMLKKLSDVSEIIKNSIEKISFEANKITKQDLLDETQKSPLLDQLRIFASEIALYDFWLSEGCAPAYLIGHSFGEYAAAYCAGIISLRDCIEIISIRQKILDKTVGYLKMCAVNLSEENIKCICLEKKIDIEISARNSPSRATIVGSPGEVRRFCNELDLLKTDYYYIQTEGGSHCSFLEKYRDEFIGALSNIKFTKKKSIMISSVFPSGEMYPSESAEYWFCHMTQAVDFAGAMKKGIKMGIDIVVDLGVSPNLLGSAMLNAVGSKIRWLPTIKFGTDYAKRIDEAKSKMNLFC